MRCSTSYPSAYPPVKMRQDADDNRRKASTTEKAARKPQKKKRIKKSLVSEGAGGQLSRGDEKEGEEQNRHL